MVRAVTPDGAPIVERGLLSMSEVAWEQAEGSGDRPVGGDGLGIARGR